MQAPKPIRSGELIGPWLNQLLAFVRSATRVTAGPGIVVRQSEEGVVISTTPEIYRRIPATIYGGPSPDAPLDPSAVLYKARPMPPFGDTQGIATPRAPDYGRPVRGDAVKIWPHAEGTPCHIVRRPHPQNPGEVLVELEVPAERINFGPCPPTDSPPPPPPERPPPPEPETPPEQRAAGGASGGVAASGGTAEGDGGGCGCVFTNWPESLDPRSR